MPQNCSPKACQTGPRGTLGSSRDVLGGRPEHPWRPRARSRGSRGSSWLPWERLGTIWACKMDVKSMKFKPRGEPRGQFAMLNGATIDRIPASLEHRDVRRPSTESRDDPQEIPGSFQHPHHHQSRPSLTKMTSGIFAKSQGSNDATTTILACSVV